MKIALLGYGVEGASAYHYFKRLYPEAEFEIYDNAESPKYDIPDGVALKSGVKDFYDIDADLVIKTPAIAPSKVSTRGSISSVTRTFFDVCPVPIIGVTGTKGKGTTATLTAEILKKAGFKVWLVGNIGVAALDKIEEIEQARVAGQKCVVVYELSSFQLWDMTKSPQVAIVLMIEPEHLNVHKDFEEYVEAKSNIVKYQHPEDTTIYFDDNDISRSIGEKSPAKKIPYVLELGSTLNIDGRPIVEKSDIALYGDHNVGNVHAAILAAWQFTQDEYAIQAAVREFRGLPHRLEPVATRNDVLFINDSFSSAPPATVAAVRAFSQPKIVIMGGFDRGLDFTDTARAIVSQPQVKRILLIGQTRHGIAAAFDACDWHDYEIIDGTLDQAVTRVNQLAEAGDVVLFSPGCASFDMFPDFNKRGDAFKELIANL
ncbi:MAG: UDP-N-acetylmuramoylalanine--D-glutamate ligase [Candidatus Saccharibacteria bacterium]|nr:UDP-N-acetylmuramoylalanine--D-glutamate ligase [Candidatus Saccharibacteria bacterium]